jgi:hypothetical protein
MQATRFTGGLDLWVIVIIIRKLYLHKDVKLKPGIRK